MAEGMYRFLAARALFVLSALFIVYATTVPFDFSRGPTLFDAELIPFWDPDRGRLHSIPDIVQNIALFVPFGFFLVLSVPRFNTGPLIVAALKTGVFGLILSACVEALQTMSELRATSATDLATNFLGAAIGAAAARIYGSWAAARLRSLVVLLLRTQPGMVIVAGFTIATVLLILAPFIPTLDVGMLRAKVRLLIDHPLGTKKLGALPTDALMFGALAFAFAQEVPSLLARRGWLKQSPVPSSLAAMIAGPLIAAWAVLLECGQLPLVHHNPGVREAIANVTGALAGALLAAAVHRGGALKPAAELGVWTRKWPWLVLGFAILLPGLRALAPFELIDVDEALDKLEPRRFLPFWMLFANLTMSTFTNVFVAAAMYLPLGYALAALKKRPVIAFAWALLLAEVLEVLQIPIANRTFDVTEGLLAASGALIGSWLFNKLVRLTTEARGDVAAAPRVARQRA